MSKRIGRRSIAALLAAVMVFTAAPVSVSTVEAVGAADEALGEVSGESWTEAAEEAVEEKGGEEGGNSYNTEEQASKSEEVGESKTEQIESRTVDEGFGDDDTGTFEDSEEMTETETAADSMMTEESTGEVTEDSETEPEIEEETRTEEEAGKENNVRATGTETIAQLKQRFPAGKYWNRVNLNYDNSDGVTGTSCPNDHNTAPNTCNNYRGYGQCWGFAYRLADGYYGSCPLDGWSQSTDKASLDSLKAGDIIQYNDHVVWVTGVDGDKITIADCNNDYHCGIRWDVSMTKSYIKNNTTFRSKWSAPYAATSGHNPIGDLNEVTGGAGSVTVRG